MLMKHSYVNISEATVPCASGVQRINVQELCPFGSLAVIFSLLFFFFFCPQKLAAAPGLCLFIPARCLLFFLLILISIPAPSSSAEDLW